MLGGGVVNEVGLRLGAAVGSRHNCPLVLLVDGALVATTFRTFAPGHGYDGAVFARVLGCCVGGHHCGCCHNRSCPRYTLNQGTTTHRLSTLLGVALSRVNIHYQISLIGMSFAH